MKRLISLILATVMLFALCACGKTDVKSGTADIEPLTKDDVIQLVVSSHNSWPYREDWKVWDYIEEGANVTLDVTALSSAESSTKTAVMFAAPELLPDAMSGSTKVGVDKYVVQGALIAFDDMEEYMPNYNAWLRTLTEEEYENNVVTRRAYDGKIYYTPVLGREKSQNVRAWLYRKDIFEKHNIEVPATFDELYEVCKQLKEIYPNSYPYCLRQKFTNLTVSGPSWKPYWSVGFYYDYNEEKWNYGPDEDVALEILTFYKKMIDEKLMPSDFMTIATNTWQELVTTDRGFIMPEYQTRIDFFNSLGRSKNPDFDLQAMVPPVAKADTGVPMVNKHNIDPTGLFITNNGDEKRIANAAKFLDWFYTDEAYELLSWGKEGETYETVDGKKQFITDENGTQANTLYGFGTYGTFTRMDPEAILAFESEDIAETRDMVLEHTLPYANPTLSIAFNEEEYAVKELYETALETYATEMLTKFLIGQEPLSKFDEFRATLHEMHLDDLMAVYESAYARMSDKK
ncbi:MAG: extracellular solute-binding protein [Oscillospiraceae bacterium]|nr:extracellular solute-binding protein [Oscillospiraceae bacterium]